MSPFGPLLVVVGAAVVLSGQVWRLSHECNGWRTTWVGVVTMFVGLGVVMAEIP